MYEKIFNHTVLFFSNMFRSLWYYNEVAYDKNTINIETS